MREGTPLSPVPLYYLNAWNRLEMLKITCVNPPSGEQDGDYKLVNSLRAEATFSLCELACEK